MEDREGEDGNEDIDELARESQDTDGMFSNTATIIPIGLSFVRDCISGVISIGITIDNPI